MKVNGKEVVIKESQTIYEYLKGNNYNLERIHYIFQEAQNHNNYKEH